MTANVEDVCAICMEEEGEQCGACTTLECGHTFHVHCVLHWFRYENSTCPLCRSRRDLMHANALTDAQRVGLLRRQKNTLPTRQRRDLAKLDEASMKMREARVSLRRLRMEHRGIFKTERALQRSIINFEVTRDRLQEKLATSHVTGVPYMRWEDERIPWAEEGSGDNDESESV